jgi:hypothetical protein
MQLRMLLGGPDSLVTSRPGTWAYGQLSDAREWQLRSDKQVMKTDRLASLRDFRCSPALLGVLNRQFCRPDFKKMGPKNHFSV